MWDFLAPFVKTLLMNKSSANFWEKISSLESEVIAVDRSHRETDFWGHPATYDAVSRVGTS